MQLLRTASCALFYIQQQLLTTIIIYCFVLIFYFLHMHLSIEDSGILVPLLFLLARPFPPLSLLCFSFFPSFLKHSDRPASATQILGLQECATMPGCSFSLLWGYLSADSFPGLSMFLEMKPPSYLFRKPRFGSFPPVAFTLTEALLPSKLSNPLFIIIMALKNGWKIQSPHIHITYTYIITYILVLSICESLLCFFFYTENTDLWSCSYKLPKPCHLPTFNSPNTHQCCFLKLVRWF